MEVLTLLCIPAASLWPWPPLAVRANFMQLSSEFKVQLMLEPASIEVTLRCFTLLSIACWRHFPENVKLRFGVRLSCKWQARHQHERHALPKSIALKMSSIKLHGRGGTWHSLSDASLLQMTTEIPAYSDTLGDMGKVSL